MSENTMKTEEAVKLVTEAVEKKPNWMFIACDSEGKGTMLINGHSGKTVTFLLDSMIKNPTLGEGMFQLLKPLVDQYQEHRKKVNKNIN
jgi:hypothetical protein